MCRFYKYKAKSFEDGVRLQCQRRGKPSFTDFLTLITRERETLHVRVYLSTCVFVQSLATLKSQSSGRVTNIS